MSGLKGAKESPIKPDYCAEMFFVFPLSNPLGSIFIFSCYSCPLCQSVWSSFPHLLLCLCAELIRKFPPCLRRNHGNLPATCWHHCMLNITPLSCHTTTCFAVDPLPAINTCFPFHNCSSNRLVWMEGGIGNAKQEECAFLSICASSVTLSNHQDQWRLHKSYKYVHFSLIKWWCLPIHMLIHRQWQNEKY